MSQNPKNRIKPELLREQKTEEEKSTYLYSFLKDNDYLQAIERFDNAKLKESQDKNSYFKVE